MLEPQSVAPLSTCTSETLKPEKFGSDSSALTHGLPSARPAEAPPDAPPAPADCPLPEQAAAPSPISNVVTHEVLSSVIVICLRVESVLGFPRRRRARQRVATAVPLADTQILSAARSLQPRIELCALTRLRRRVHRLCTPVYFGRNCSAGSQLFRGRGKLYTSRRLTSVRREMPSCSAARV
jgi:hypothetical protein